MQRIPLREIAEKLPGYERFADYEDRDEGLCLHHRDFMMECGTPELMTFSEKVRFYSMADCLMAAVQKIIDRYAKSLVYICPVDFCRNDCADSCRLPDSPLLRRFRRTVPPFGCVPVLPEQREVFRDAMDCNLQGLTQVLFYLPENQIFLVPDIHGSVMVEAEEAKIKEILRLFQDEGNPDLTVHAQQESRECPCRPVKYEPSLRRYQCQLEKSRKALAEPEQSWELPLPVLPGEFGSEPLSLSFAGRAAYYTALHRATESCLVLLQEFPEKTALAGRFYGGMHFTVRASEQTDPALIRMRHKLPERYDGAFRLSPPDLSLLEDVIYCNARGWSEWELFSRDRRFRIRFRLDENILRSYC